MDLSKHLLDLARERKQMNSPAYREGRRPSLSTLVYGEPDKSPDLELAYGAPSVDKLHCGPVELASRRKISMATEWHVRAFSYRDGPLLRHPSSNRSSLRLVAGTTNGYCIHTAGNRQLRKCPALLRVETTKKT